jgi:hypothetical protein
MSSSDHDPVLERAIEELERLPAVERAAMERVIAAAAVARVTPADQPVLDELSAVRGWPRAWRIAATLAMVSAAAVVGFMVRGAAPGSTVDAAHQSAAVATAAPTTARAVVQPVTDVPGAAKPVLQQFVFHSARAKRVSVVGDFNQWNPSSAPMVPSAEGTLWSVLVPILPGRHVYAYMVDDSILTLDPTAATARDPDFGTKASVVLVGKP